MSYAPAGAFKRTPQKKPRQRQPSEKHTVNHFGSLREYAAHIDALKPIEGDSSQNLAGEFQPLSYGETMAILRKGGAWAEGAKHLQRVKVPNAFIIAEIDRLKAHSAPVGFVPLIPNLLTNQPDSMLAISPAKTQARVLRISVGASISCGVDAESVYNRGRALLAAIRAFEAHGVAVEVSGYCATTNKNQNAMIASSFVIKKANAPLNVAALAFALCNACMHRRPHFREIEAAPTWAKHTRNGYGWPCSLNMGADIHIPMMCKPQNAACKTPESAARYVFAFIESFINKMLESPKK